MRWWTLMYHKMKIIYVFGLNFRTGNSAAVCSEHQHFKLTHLTSFFFFYYSIFSRPQRN